MALQIGSQNEPSTYDTWTWWSMGEAALRVIQNLRLIHRLGQFSAGPYAAGAFHCGVTKIPIVKL